MGDSVVGTTGTGADGSQVSPVLVGGLDLNGIARTLRVGVDGIVETLAVPGTLDDLSNVTGADTGAKGSLLVATTIGQYVPLQVCTVQTGAPTTTYITPLVYDNTAVTGGLYAWITTAYVKIGGLAS